MNYGTKGLNAEALQFYKSNEELIEKRRKKRDEEYEAHKQENMKEAHWMKCPKCGNTMEEFELSTVMLDKCTNCYGIYFDAGELEILLKAKKSESLFETMKKFMGPIS